MKTKTVVIDANVIISAFAFGGRPAAVVELALRREFLSATGENILAEVRKNLLGKLGFEPKHVDRIPRGILRGFLCLCPIGESEINSAPG